MPLRVESQVGRVVKTGDGAIAAAQVQQQCRRNGVVVVQTGNPVVKEGATRVADLVRQTVGIAIGSRVLAIGGGPGPVKGNLASAADGVVQLQRRDKGAALAQVRTGSVLREAGAGGRREQRLDFQRNRIQAVRGNDVAGKCGGRSCDEVSS